MYTPPEGSTFYTDRQERDGIVDIETTILDILSEIGDCNIFVAGDLNARTGSEDDFIQDDNIMHLPGVEDWYPVDDFNVPRSSRDAQTNAFGRSLLDMCRTLGIHMLNGRLPGDQDGEFTFCARAGNSVVDYMLVSSELFNTVTDFQVIAMLESDHFPLTCNIPCNLHVQQDIQDESAVRPHIRVKWDEAKRVDFQDILSDNTSSNMLHQAEAALEQNDINSSVGLLVEVLQRAAHEMECAPATQKHHPGPSRRKNADWWDQECDDNRRMTARHLRAYRNTRLDVDLNSYLDSKAMYQNTCRSKEAEHRREMLQKLISACHWSTMKIFSVPSEKYHYH